MMRAMRANAKYVFFILAFTFIGWMAYGQVQDIMTPGQNVALKINGTEIPWPTFQRAVQEAAQLQRQQAGSTPTTLEQNRELENQVVDQLIQTALLREQYARLGITVTDEEVIAAARTSPPAEMLQEPQFQTDGKPDLGKWQAFLATTTDRPFLDWLDARYREEIPQIKLAQFLTADVYASDAKLWRLYRDQHDSVRVAVLAVRPEDIPDNAVSVTDQQLERYVTEHQDELRRPAQAFLSYVALDRRPSPADSAAALARVREIRARVATGDAQTFAAVAREVSADSVSGQKGGDLGWMHRTEPSVEETFLAAMRSLRPGQVSQPVRSSFGYHILRVAAARGDSVRVSHILIPIELVDAHLDAVEARADTLDRLTAAQSDAAALDSAAAAMHLPIARTRLVEGERLTLGRYVIPDVSVWAFETRVGETSQVIEGQVAYYVFRLDSLVEGGVPPLAETRETVARAVRHEAKKGLAADRARHLADTVRSARSLAAVGQTLGIGVPTFGPFTRVAPPAPLAAEPLVLGTAFGIRVGEKAGPIIGERAAYFVELLWRKSADSLAWLAQRDAQRAAIAVPARQARISAFLADVRAQATIIDRRQELARKGTQVAPVAF